MRSNTALFLLAALAVVGVALVLDDMPVDDAYISFRYAENLRDGLGLSFNEGERVEGYTNFLWVLLLSAGSFVHGDIPGLAQVLSVLFSVLTVGVCIDLLSRYDASIPGAALLVGSAPWLYWGQNGLETSLFTFLVLLGFRFWSIEAGGYTMATVTFALATLTRPEGALFFLILVGVDRPWRGKAARGLAAFVVFLVVLESFRWFYFGALAPNTFYAKLGGLPTLVRGLARFSTFCLRGGGLLYLGGIVFLIWKEGDRMRRETRGLLAAVGIYFGYLIYSGGDIYYLYRYYVPIVPLLTIALARMLRHRTAPWLTAVWTVGAVAWLASPWWFGPDHESRLLSLASDRSRVVVGEWMRENLPEDSSIALNPIGIIPYITGFTTYDMVGLTDPRIARLDMTGKPLGAAGHGKYNAAYILSRDPDYIVLSNAVAYNLKASDGSPYRQPTRVPASALEGLFRKDFPYLPGDAEMYSLGRFAADYECWIVPVSRDDSFVLFKNGKHEDRFR